jgi:glutathione S-transferase
MLTILYSFRRCPYAMRARMALAYAQIEYEHREILLKDKPISMLNYSAKGTVPVLVVGAHIIDESLDVMRWALQQNDPDEWLKNNHQFELIKKCDTKFKPQLDKYKYSDRFECSETHYRSASLWFLIELNNCLAQHKYLMSDSLSLADIAIFPFIRQFSFVNKKWFDGNEYRYLQNWLEALLESTLFIKIMQKHQLWKDK